jgi:REP element-mobilizing transposase RayT
MTYLLTFNCYGTHLPGVERGWVDRARGDHRGSYQDPRPGLLSHVRRISGASFQLDLVRSRIVLAAIRETCEFRCWDLWAAHIRTTHVHVVADGFADPDRVITDLKAYASRALRRHDFAAVQRKFWARGGSTRRLYTPEAVNAAIKYVADKQGEAMAVYVMSPRLRAGLDG